MRTRIPHLTSSFLISSVLGLLLAASPARADLLPRNPSECEGRSAGAECTRPSDDKKGVCAFGAPDRAGRSALFCKVGDVTPSPSAAPSSSVEPVPSGSSKKGAGCSVGGDASDTGPVWLLALAALFVARRARPGSRPRSAD